MSKVFMGIKQKRFQESLTQTRAIGRASMLRGCQAARKGRCAEFFRESSTCFVCKARKVF